MCQWAEYTILCVRLKEGFLNFAHLIWVIDFKWYLLKLHRHCSSGKHIDCAHRDHIAPEIASFTGSTRWHLMGALSEMSSFVHVVACRLYWTFVMGFQYGAKLLLKILLTFVYWILCSIHQWYLDWKYRMFSFNEINLEIFVSQNDIFINDQLIREI